MDKTLSTWIGSTREMFKLSSTWDEQLVHEVKVYASLPLLTGYNI